MASYKLSHRAAEDLSGIAVNSLNQWGVRQAGAYVNTIHQTMLKLANTPQLQAHPRFMLQKFLSPGAGPENICLPLRTLSPFTQETLTALWIQFRAKAN